MNFIPTPHWTLGGFLPTILGGQGSLSSIDSVAFHSDDERWMFRALLEGMNGAGISNPNPSVGCVLVKNGKQIAVGSTEAYRKRHGERVAWESLRAAGQLSNLQDCTAYVTLEPCSHQGHQPACVDLLIENKIGRVVIANRDPNPKVSGQGIAKLRQHNIDVTVGILNNAALLWHFPFLVSQIKRKPLLIGKWAQTPNGLLADDNGVSKWITGPKTRAYGQWLRHKYDAILVGAGTVIADHPRLTVRDCALPVRRQPLRIILDLRSRLQSINQELISSTFSQETPTVLMLDRNAKAPVGLPDWVPVARINGSHPVSGLLDWSQSTEAEGIFGKPIQSIFIEGGSKILNLFLSAGALDVLHVTTGTKEFTGTLNRIAFHPGESAFTEVSRNGIDGDLLCEYVRGELLSEVLETQSKGPRGALD